MLASLHIENVAVIKRADIDFQSGFCVLTGETGAGKSILIDSVNALVGAKIGRDIVRAGQDKAVISAYFCGFDDEIAQNLARLGIETQAPDGEREIVLQRTVTSDGRSTARINGASVTQAILREAGGMLINIHGQSDSQKLMQKSSHLALLDEYAQTEPILREYKETYGEWHELRAKLDALKTNSAEMLRTKEMLEYQIREIDAAKLSPDEEDRLRERRDRLLNLEKISHGIRLASRALTDSEKSTAASLVYKASGALSSISDLISDLEPIVDELDRIENRLGEISSTVKEYLDVDVDDPTREIDKIESRLDTIKRLGRKYGADIADILNYRADAEKKLAELTVTDDTVAEYQQRVSELYDRATEIGARLSQARHEKAKLLSDGVLQTLAYLDMPGVRFEIGLKPTGKLTPDGTDDCEFLIATNPGNQPGPLIKIASGGELSRIMLALRSVLNQRQGVPTTVYDEIDTGISGKTARKVGLKLRAVSEFEQVICVTHSAQVASLGTAHYLIEKKQTETGAETNVTLLDDDRRVSEVARILGGLTVTKTQTDAARELIDRTDE